MLTGLISLQQRRRAKTMIIETPYELEEIVYHVYTPRSPANPQDKGKWFVTPGFVNRFLYGKRGLSIDITWVGTISAKEVGVTLFNDLESAIEIAFEKNVAAGNDAITLREETRKNVERNTRYMLGEE